MVFVRSLLFVATTLAASKQPMMLFGAPSANNNSKTNSTCNRTSAESACGRLDPLIAPQHVIAPLMLPCAALLFTHMPTLLLASKARVRDLKEATAQVAVAWLSVCSVAWLYTRYSPAVAYALSLHSSLYLLSQPSSPTLVVGRLTDLFVRETCVTTILLCAWYGGPPLPVVDVPGVAGSCCGAASHLAGFILPDLAGPVAMWLARRLVVIDGGHSD